MLLSKTDASGYELSGHVAVTWVDPVLSLLSESVAGIVAALSGFSGIPEQLDNIPDSLRRQQIEASTKVASQLPGNVIFGNHRHKLTSSDSRSGSFSKFVETVRSKHTSPAANRLCVSLLFASLVIRPDICGTDIWPSRMYARCSHCLATS